jgi:SAM-dependent methyltransferase
MITRHLDIGCGNRPRNPYRCGELYGIDLVAGHAGGVEVRAANLALEPIPYPNAHFDSVSAYDVLEHVPRLLPTANGRATRFPFVELMDEIWRVLVPGGRFYGYTPAFPHALAFQDPTHVNTITRRTHEYFVRPTLSGRMYGFRGDFSVIRVVPALVAEHEYEPTGGAGWIGRYRLHRRERRGENTHLVWEFVANK